MAPATRQEPFLQLPIDKLVGRLLRVHLCIYKAERAVESGAQCVHTDNNRSRNARSDQAIFYRGCAGMVF